MRVEERRDPDIRGHFQSFITDSDTPVVPQSAKKGYSTLFDTPSADPDAVLPQAATELPFIIENPERSHFFNTDCVSCHTSSQRIILKELTDTSNAGMKPVPGITNSIASRAAQNTEKDLRNFGYFRSFEALNEEAPTSPSISGRTLNESIEAARIINEGLAMK